MCSDLHRAIGGPPLELAEQPHHLVPRDRERSGEINRFGSLWVTNQESNRVERLDRTGKAVASVRVGGFPVHTTVGAGAVWVTCLNSGTVRRIDPSTNEV